MSYDRDMPLIRAHGLASPEGLVDVVTFVLLTIQQPFYQVAKQMQDYRETGADCRFLWGSKGKGHAYAVAHAAVLHAAIVKGSQVNDTAGVIDVLTAIPGLGIVKASFVAQLLGFEVACLDMHNLKRLGMAETALRLAKSCKPETRRRKIAEYVALCADTGGSRFWWNSWCAFVAGKRGSPLTTGDAVSAFHVAAFDLA